MLHKVLKWRKELKRIVYRIVNSRKELSEIKGMDN